MESEKVKEIKDCLEKFKDDRIGYWTNGIDRFMLTKEDALTLINELETENKNKTDTITVLLNKQEFYEKEQLKQFVERLKEKLKEVHKTNRMLLMPERDIVLSTIENCFQLVDETLKEFIK